jgi:hypothetical protein
MDPLPIIEDLNPFYNGSSSLPMGLEGMAIHQFSLQGTKEALCNCIVPRQFARQLIVQVIPAVLRAAR